MTISTKFINLRVCPLVKCHQISFFKHFNFGFGWTSATTDLTVLSSEWVKHQTHNPTCQTCNHVFTLQGSLSLPIDIQYNTNGYEWGLPSDLIY